MKISAHGSSRSYRQVARANAAEATAQRILDAFAACMRDRWFDEITLDEVARRAEVTVRTVIRRFGAKDGLLKDFVAAFVLQVNELRQAAPGDVSAAVARVLDVYEKWGDSVIRNLAQEPRHAALKPLLDHGRAEHRSQTAAAYAPWLDPLPEPERRRVLDALVVATDVYTWKLVRRDMGRSREETHIMLRQLVDAVLAQASMLAPNAGRGST